MKFVLTKQANSTAVGHWIAFAWSYILAQITLRDALRNHTADLHQRLDAAVGELSSVDAYREFVANTYAFRKAIEPTLSVLFEWKFINLAEPLRIDLDDLEYGPVNIPLAEAVSGSFANLGRLYVLEGSAVGARLLYKRAQKLGFSQSFGARHLALQANDKGRWKRFTQLLETVDPVHHPEALTAAKELFEFAVEVYS